MGAQAGGEGGGPCLDDAGLYVGRVWREGVGPSVVAVCGGRMHDITGPAAPTLSALLEADDIPGAVAAAECEDIGSADDLAGASVEPSDPDATRLLAPCDLQAVKACGVTFARSMIERVIEERAAGDPAKSLYPAIVIGPACSSEGFRLFYLRAWLE